MRRITVVVADSEPGWCTVCEGVLRHEKDILIVAHAEQHDDAMSVTVQLSPNILLCSLRFAATASYSLLATLQQRCPATLAVLWTDDAVGEDQLVWALGRGARGFLNRNHFRRQLARAMRGVAGGEAWVPRRMLGTIGDRLIR